TPPTSTTPSPSPSPGSSASSPQPTSSHQYSLAAPRSNAFKQSPRLASFRRIAPPINRSERRLCRRNRWSWGEAGRSGAEGDATTAGRGATPPSGSNRVRRHSAEDGLGRHLGAVLVGLRSARQQ